MWIHIKLFLLLFWKKSEMWILEPLFQISTCGPRSLDPVGKLKKSLDFKKFGKSKKTKKQKNQKNNSLGLPFIAIKDEDNVHYPTPLGP